ncbi:O-antigen ligase family protein [Clostridium botulinum]|uniref:O-antigen ligase family protein n=1 Tax=Clostridium botulinum TaxID=1491 RepID=UPI0006A6F6A4|nr:O-antigen ligase family protein [Clostridium botulinum]KON08828.1 membrane protein [Clostridium botulinum]MBY6898455.1 O-antigen ligase family protein [Clostridium botulinum]MBY6906078.1 O-antigen ligase family protein [Clostridium botulinum]MBY6912918.1 O-antigen ligase family protein [Clostridium botulinum]MBY6927531.1 O-antigen ligase family protein [Clostridium botulinum]
MNKLKKLNFNMIFLYVLLTFFVIPRDLQGEFKIIFIVGFFLINIICVSINNIEIKLKKSDVLLYFFIITISIVMLIISPYTIIFTIGTFAFLVVTHMSVSKKHYIFKNYLNRTIYVMCLVSIIMQLMLGRYSTINGKISLNIIGDKNFSGVVMILFFMYCAKNKFYLGEVLSVFTILILDSRASLITLILFFIVRLFKDTIWSVLQKLRLNKVYKLFALMLIIIISISYIWVSRVTIYGVKEYQQSLNDTSNKMRFVANIYAIDLIKNNKKELMFYGYDNDFKDIFGIYDYEIDSHRKFMGVRLVQPHNSIINVIIRTGIIFSLLYFYILSRIIDKLYTKDNLEYILPYLFSALFLHELLNSRFLMFWIIVLCLPINKIISTKRYKINL